MTNENGNVGMKPDLLELFPSEVMTNVLCSLPSTDALASLIRASRFANECFKTIKQRVLREVLMNELGCVIRDAIFCEYQDGIDFNVDDEVETLMTTTAEYWQLLHQTTTAEIQQRLTPDVVIKIIHRKRLLQRITHFLSGPILDEIRILDANAAQPLTDAEQRRFLQALLRYSVLLRYDPHDTDNEPDEILWHDHPCLHMFAAWEMQQVADIGSYMSTLWYTLLYGGRCGPRGGQQGSGGGSEERYMKEYNLTMKYAHDLRTLWRKLDSSVAEVPVLMSVLTGLTALRTRSSQR
ncbi:hypothetical protein NQ176_g8668 [Zarea fungicola]|uniref:Uncharacterized protein n=1 Tax=Zarea fungicola TaxID=93591 RepID=A0ACC1MSE1_9HYPO|nr:hypothetical protein NQ176_g8668 [Lecanicillium fungicola]